MSLTDITRIAATQSARDGLCRYDDPDLWFSTAARTRAIAICANCPVAAACGQAALDLGASDGVWAGVVLPGNRTLAPLARARERLQAAVEHHRQRPPDQQIRALVLRKALRHAATREQARRVMSEAIRYATPHQEQALRGLRKAVDDNRRGAPRVRNADLMIREAVRYAADQERVSA